MNQNKDIILATKPVGKLLFSLAIPAITAQLINVLYNMVDRMFIGHIPEVGATALTGVGITFPIIMLISAFSMLIGMGGAPRAAIEMGRGDNDKAEHILGNCVLTLLLLSAILTIFFLIFRKSILVFFGASENTLPYAMRYMTIYACGTIFVQIALGLNIFITSQGFAKTSMYTVLIGAILNLILDPILIYGCNLGVAGAAIATVFSQGISALWVLRFLTGKRTKLKIKKEYLPLKKEILIPVLALGLSPFIMQSTESLLSVCLNTSLQKYGGDMAVGAMTILMSVMQFSMLPILGLTQGAQPIISFNYGGKNAKRVKQTIKLLIISAFIYSFSLWGLIMIKPTLFIRIFTNSTALIDFSSWALRIFMAVSCLMGLQVACQQTFLALGEAKISMFLALLRKMLLLIPLIYILPHVFQDKVFAVFVAEPIADTLAIATTIILFFFHFKKLMNQLENKPIEQP